MKNIFELIEKLIKYKNSSPPDSPPQIIGIDFSKNCCAVIGSYDPLTKEFSVKEVLHDKIYLP